MATSKRQQQRTDQPDRQQGDKLAGAVAKAAPPVASRNANIATDDKSDQTHRSIEVPETYKSPTTGRNTKLGRKVEKPAEPKPGGPSGQTERAKHNKRHANK